MIFFLIINNIGVIFYHFFFNLVVLIDIEGVSLWGY